MPQNWPIISIVPSFPMTAISLKRALKSMAKSLIIIHLNCNHPRSGSESPNNRNTGFIDCRIYKVSDFGHKFGFSPQVLPIFGSCVGGQAIDNRVFDDMFSEILLEIRFNSLEVSIKSGLDQKLSQSFLRLNQLLYWLSNRFITSNEAITHFRSFLRDKQIIKKDLRDPIKGYKIDETI